MNRPECKPLRLLFASMHAHLPDRVGGFECSTHDLAITLLEMGHHVEVLCCAREELIGFRGHLDPTFLKGDRHCGYPTHRAAQPDRVLPTLANQLQPDWIVLHPDKEFRLESSAWFLGGNVAVYVRDVEFGPMSWRLRELPSARFIANSQFTAARLKALYGLDAHVAPPIIRAERYQTTVTGARVLFVNPVPKKGVEVVLEVAARLPSVEFDVVEAWPISESQLAHYRNRATALPNVHWHPHQLDMRAIYSRAALLIVPSQWEEAWGRVTTEAQLNGIPVIASNRGGLPEAVGEGGVLIDDFANPDAWVLAVESVLGDSGALTRLGASARRHAMAPSRSPGHVAGRLLDFLCGEEWRSTSNGSAMGELANQGAE